MNDWRLSGSVKAPLSVLKWVKSYEIAVVISWPVQDQLACWIKGGYGFSKAPQATSEGGTAGRIIS